MWPRLTVPSRALERAARAGSNSTLTAVGAVRPQVAGTKPAIWAAVITIEVVGGEASVGAQPGTLVETEEGEREEQCTTAQHVPYPFRFFPCGIVQGLEQIQKSAAGNAAGACFRCRIDFLLISFEDRNAK